MTELLEHFMRLRGEGRKLLVPYVMGGIPDRFTFADALHAVETDADAVEVGLPFSDPLMDGPVIAAAGERAIAAGVGPLDAMAASGGVQKSCPRIAMTYYNPIHRVGEEAFCRRAVEAHFDGVIVPDIPLEESATLRMSAARTGLAWIPLVAPTSPAERVTKLVASATGFVYAVSTLGVTGARASLSERAALVVSACRQATDLPILVGIGVSTAEQAVEATQSADGVVIGTTVVDLILERGAAAARDFLSSVRAALDRA
ncbi:MAG: tryptophan synthase alpha chain [Actinomycetota bacterium]|nr:tryptophan synthase alpha chain [Actinomycetota bacterium]